MRFYCPALLWQMGLAVLVAQSALSVTIRVPEQHKTIQKAIDQATDGDTVLVSPGTYRERIRMKEGVAVRSAGGDGMGKLGLKRAEETIIDGEGGQEPGVIMAESSTLDGFTVTKVGRYDESEWNKHHATQGNDQSHENIGQPGIAGIEVKEIQCTLRHNIVHHNGGRGIGIVGSLKKTGSPIIFRNICYRNMGGGIGIMTESTAVIERNVCFQNFHAGIGMNGASPLIIGNKCYENIRAGIGISHDSSPIVRGNRCYKNRRAGIGVRDGASPMIVGNECYENDMAGIGQMSDAVTMLIGNDCHHNKAAGIGFAPCKKGRSTVVDNRVIDNALVAVGIQAGWEVRLLGNELAREGGLPPLAMVFQGAEAIFINNKIQGSGVAGIRVAGKVRAENNEIKGTTLRKSGPPNNGIWALPGSQVAMTGNHVHGWRHALHATDAEVSVIGNTVSHFHQRAFLIENPSKAAVVSGNEVK